MLCYFLEQEQNGASKAGSYQCRDVPNVMGLGEVTWGALLEHKSSLKTGHWASPTLRDAEEERSHGIEEGWVKETFKGKRAVLCQSRPAVQHMRTED